VSMRVRKRVVVRGIVQGVGFRWYTRRHASLLGLGGFVRNMPDGSVLIEVEGEDSLVSSLIEKVKIGPTHAIVESVEVEELSPIGENVFRIIYS